MYEERIDAFREHLAALRGVSGESIEVVSGALEAIGEFDTRFRSFGNATLTNGATPQSTIEGSFDALLKAIAKGTTAAILAWAAQSTEIISNFVIQLINERTLSGEAIKALRHTMAVAVEAGQKARVLLDRDALRDAVEQANSLVQEIKEQAGVAGEAANLTFYRDFADAELRAAGGFRIAAIFLVSATVGIATFYALWEFFHPAAEPDWTAVIYRTAILVGIGALSAYLARQAGQHRRLYNWANALEVQLQSFQNFIAPMTDEERHEVRLHFARRVLGSPPDPKTGESSDDTVPTAQILDIAAAAIRRGTTS